MSMVVPLSAAQILRAGSLLLFLGATERPVRGARTDAGSGEIDLALQSVG
jgi:hypothetical protein